ncbi:MAG: hypothetical protein JWP38_2233 [Herbaspirillum sp.]|nr:hypothetical protein [Herbaspirillum sp.]
MKKLYAGFFVLLLNMNYCYSAEDMTFFGMTLGAEFDYPSCKGERSQICVFAAKTVPTPSGIAVKVRSMAFPRDLVPNWIVLEDADVETFDAENVVQSIIVHTDVLSADIGEKGINSIYEHLVARLGKESKRTPMTVFGQRYHYAAIWNKPWGVVTFATAVSTPHGVLPIISIASNKYVDMWEKNKQLQQQRNTKAEEKKLKF